MDELINTRLYTDVCSIIEQGRKEAYASVNQKMIETYWNIGRRIVEEEQNGEARAEYGAQIIAQLAEQLTHQYGKGFSKRYLAYFRQFYLTISDLKILQTRLQNLTWSHIQRTLRVEDPTTIRWYLEMASKEMWSVRTLDRNISTQYFERHFVQPSLPMTETEPHQFELLKSPVVAEFLGFKQDDSYSEEELERTEGDNPTIGIVLCSETSKDIARYSILKDNDHLFATKYKTYLPTEEQLRTEIERQKQLFYQQHGTK